MTDQDTLALMVSCRTCGKPLAYAGVGRPASLCDSCYPDTYPPRKRRHEVPSPLSRRSDPSTSADAAASIPSGAVETRILEAFDQFGWLNSSEVANVLEDAHEPTVVTAVSRLVGSGALVKTGTTRPSNRGRPSIVYTLADA